MSRLTKCMLAVLIISTVASAVFLTGVVDVRAVPGLYVVFPLAAIFYGLFVICHALEREVAQFDAEQHTRHDAATTGEPPRTVEFLHKHDHHDHHESLAA
jgi:ABC-type nickel/cobalt efflux system permease component RcnA